MDPPSTLQCELRPYQKQALYWMIQLEKGNYADEGATTLHPCWEAYHLADKYVDLYSVQYTYNLQTHAIRLFLSRFSSCRRNLVVYLNTFSGDATIEFPSTLQMARGGVCSFASQFY